MAYNNNPYSYGNNQYNPNEFNPNGDSYNGQQGANASTMNSAVQSNGGNPAGGKDAFSAMLNHAAALNQYIHGSGRQQPATAPVPQRSETGNAAPRGLPSFAANSAGGYFTPPNDAINGPASSSGGSQPTAPAAPAPVNTAPAAPVQAPSTGPSGQPVAAPGSRGHAVDHPAHAGQTPDDIANDWSRNAGYEWLAGKGYILDQYYTQATRAAAAGYNGIDFVDWLHHAHPEVSNPLYMRSQRDTYADAAKDPYLQNPGYLNENPSDPNSSNYNPAPFGVNPKTNLPYKSQSEADADGYSAPLPPGSTDPNSPNFNPAPWGVNPSTNLPFKSQYEAEQYGKTPAGQNPPTPGTPPDAANPFTPGPNYVPPASTPPPSGPGTVPSIESQPQTGLPPGGGGQGGQGGPGQVSDFESAMSKIFGRQSDQLSRKMNAQAALTGQNNSGGYLQSLGNAQAQLSAQQSGLLADYQNKNYNSALDRALDLYKTNQGNATQRYSIDTQKEIAMKGQELQKYGIDLNDTLQRYGITTDDAFKRFKANLDAQTAKDVANINGQNQISGAEASARVAGAAAQTQLEMARLNADTQRYGTDVDRERNILSYILGSYNLGNDAMKNIIGTGNSAGINQTPFPTGNVVVKP